GAGDLDDLRPEGFQQFHGLVETLQHTRLEAVVVEFFDHADPQTFDVTGAGGLDDRRNGLVDGGGVPRVVSGEGLVQQGGVQDVAGEGAGGVQGGGEGDHPVPGGATVGGFG